MTIVSEEKRSVELKTSPKQVKVPTILQQAGTECGAASLGMVLAHNGLWKTLDELRHDVGVDRDGASAVAILDCADSLGLRSKGSRISVEQINDLSLPAILWWNRCHFLVLEGASKGGVHLNDPARGRVTLPVDEFERGFSGVALEFELTPEFRPGGAKFSTAESLWERLKTSKRGAIYATYAGVLGMLLGILAAPLSQVFINEGLGAGNKELIPQVGLALLSVGIFRSSLNLLQYGVLGRLQSKFTLIGASGVLNRLLRLPMMFYMERSVGDLSQRVGYNSQVSTLLAGQMASAAIAVLALFGYAVLLLYYSLSIGIIVLLISAINVLVLRAVMDRRTTMQGRILRRQNDLRGLATASIRNIETLKSTGQENQTFTRLSAMQTDYVSATAALVPSSALLAALPVALMALTNAVILVLGGLSISSGSLTLGGLLAIQALAMSLSQPINTLMSTGGQLQVVTSSLEALDDVLANPVDTRFERQVLQKGDPVISFSGHLQIRNLCFGYGDKAPLLLDNFSLDLQPGRRIALVGVSGAGKSTIGNLAAGLLQPRSGEVLFDGLPLDQYPSGVLEQRLAKVDQNVVLFSGTLSDNVALWDSTVPSSQIANALADAQVYDDILAREQALHCTVEEDGRNFSGGQCQRIEIARALVRNPSLIVLDEATSALDDVTELLVMNAIRRRGVAALIIAHRLSTIRDADEIIVLGRGGAVLERGTHEDLIKTGGTYAQMVEDAGEGGNVGS